jgi:Ca2+-binding EF-hand superfamily protein
LVHPTDFKFGLKKYGCEISEDEMMSLLKYFDTAKCGYLSVNEMMHAMRSSSLNEKR